MKKTIVILVLIISVLFCLSAGPFGLELGWDESDLLENSINYRDYPEDKYFAVDAPFQHWIFPYYYASYTEDGIVNISAYSELMTPATADGAEVWAYFSEAFNDFCTFYGLPHVIVEDYADEASKLPANFTSSLIAGKIKLVAVWFVDEYAIFLDMYGYEDKTVDLSCEVWLYKDSIGYVEELKTQYDFFMPKTKEEITW